jgi:hypothetical protein
MSNATPSPACQQAQAALRFHPLDVRDCPYFSDYPPQVRSVAIFAARAIASAPSAALLIPHGVPLPEGVDVLLACRLAETVAVPAGSRLNLTVDGSVMLQSVAKSLQDAAAAADRALSGDAAE